MTEFLERIRQDIRDINPLDVEVEPGVKVRDLKTPDECTSAILKLEVEIGRIMGQIARSEAEPSSVRPGWRSNAQGAIRWKKRAMKAVRAHAVTLAQAGATRTGTKGNAILKVIREDIGEDEFELYVATARQRYPEAFRPVDNGFNGENR